MVVRIIVIRFISGVKLVARRLNPAPQAPFGGFHNAILVIGK